MKEYMDIMRIDDWNDLSILDDNGNARYVYDVGELPRADVVEKEKIAKAIGEIIDKSFISDIYNNRTDDEIVKLDDVIEILRRTVKGEK